MVGLTSVFDEWTVLEHGPLVRLADNLWHVTGGLPPPFQWTTRGMVIAKRRDGDLLIHNAIALDDESMSQLESLGEPRYVVVPNRGHRLDCAIYKKRYPRSQVLCPLGALKAVARIVEVAGTYDDYPADDDVTLEYIAGTRPVEGMLGVRSDDGLTLVFNDLLHNVHKLDPGIVSLLYRFVLGLGRERANVHRVLARLMVSDRRMFRTELERFADIRDLRRVIVAHGDPAVIDEPGSYLRTAASRV